MFFVFNWDSRISKHTKYDKCPSILIFSEVWKFGKLSISVAHLHLKVKFVKCERFGVIMVGLVSATFSVFKREGP